jgi:hypothetical protein
MPGIFGGQYGFGSFRTPTGSFSPVGMGDWGTTLSGLVQAAAPILQTYLAGRNQPQGFAPALLPALGGVLGRAALPTIAGAAGAGIAGLLGGNGGELFGETAERVRPLRHVPVEGPDGKLYWFGYLGKPVLWGGDLSAARRVQRVARRASRGVARRRSVRRR